MSGPLWTFVYPQHPSVDSHTISLPFLFRDAQFQLNRSLPTTQPWGYIYSPSKHTHKINVCHTWRQLVGMYRLLSTPRNQKSKQHVVQWKNAPRPAKIVTQTKKIDVKIAVAWPDEETSERRVGESSRRERWVNSSQAFLPPLFMSADNTSTATGCWALLHPLRAQLKEHMWTHLSIMSPLSSEPCEAAGLLRFHVRIQADPSWKIQIEIQLVGTRQNQSVSFEDKEAGATARV